MHSEAADADVHVEVIHRIADLDPSEHHGAFALAIALFGLEGLREVPYGRFPGDAKLCPRDGFYLDPDLRPDKRWLWEICLRPRLSIERKVFAIAHETAEWYLKLVGYTKPDAEQVADAIAAGIVAPRRQFLESLKAHGPNLSELALDFDATETCVGLRYGEVMVRPIVVVAPAGCRFRGGEAWDFHDESTLKAAAFGKEDLPGVHKVKITDKRKRFFFRYTG
jgi:hypothetical protein